ncbi:MAG: hypothetical protein HOM21_13155, partial [Halobacteriovoraceae bacterium]|nr:hypothetical protein [Halobacteriovoraceae bacterium]
ELRKNIGSWNVKEFEKNLDPWLLKLEQGMRRKGYGEQFVNQIIGQMKGFSDYGFPESHAISFALIAYASSYLKCHHPAAFFTGVLNSQPMGFYSPHNLLRAAKNDGVTVLPPSVMDSQWDSTLEKNEREATHSIRMGFRLINNLSKRGVELLQGRRNDNWKSFEDFIKDCKLFRDDLTALAAADAFHCFGLSRSNALWKAEAVPFKPLVDREEELLDWQEEGRLERVEKDFMAFNTSMADHPVRIIRQEAWSYSIDPRKVLTAKRLESMGRNITVDVFGMVRVRQAPPSANGMVFITLEDETGFLNLVVTPSTYAAFHPLLEDKTFLCINGKLQKASNYHSLLVNYVHSPVQKVAEVLSLDAGKRAIKTTEIAPSSRNYY